MSEREEHLTRLLEKIKAGECVLFLGAGASKEVGGLTECNLCKKISETLAGGALDNTNLAELCSLLVAQPGINRRDIEEIVIDAFESLQPGDPHVSMTRYSWPAIFTTNYDRVLEKAYDSSQDKAQRLKSLVKREPILSTNRSEVALYHLNGRIDYLADPDTPLVLTREDWYRTAGNRQDMLSVLKSLVQANTWLFVGYSFRDEIVLNLIEELSQQIGMDFVPWSYAILPSDDRYVKNFLKSKKIIPINMAFSEFTQQLANEERVREARELSQRLVSRYVELPEARIEIPPKKRVEMEHTFRILSKELITDSNIRSFYRGNQPTWGDLADDTDMRRELSQRIEDRILRELQEIEKPASLYMITSAAGSGKSTLLKRIAFNMYKNRGTPILILRATGRFDWQSISEFCKTANQRVLLLADDADMYYPEFRRLRLDLRDHRVPVTILGAARKAQWNARIEESRIDVNNEYALSESLTDKEMESLFLKLSNEEFIEVSSYKPKEYWLEKWRHIHDHQILVIMREVVDGGEFDRIIVDEYDKIPNELGKQAYFLVCCTYRFRYPMERMLLKELVCPTYSWIKFYEEAIRTATETIIIEDFDHMTGDCHFRARHSVIARVLTDARTSSKEELVDRLCEIIRGMPPHSRTSLRLARDLLMNEDIREYLGEIRLIMRLFEAGLGRFPEDIVILHHFGIIKMNQEDYHGAQQIFERALQISENNHAVLHSLGELNRKRAFASSGEGLEDLYAKRAEEYYIKTRKISATEHGYSSHALMCLQRARRCGDRAKKDSLLATAMEIIAEGESSLPPDEVNFLPKLKAEVFAALGSYEKASRRYEQLAEMDRTPDILTRWGWIEFIRGNHGRSLELAMEADRIEKSNPHTLKLLVWSLEKLRLITDANWFKIVEKAEKVLEDNHKIKFLLGVTYWCSGKPRESSNLFGFARRLAGDMRGLGQIKIRYGHDDSENSFEGRVKKRERDHGFITLSDKGQDVYYRNQGKWRLLKDEQKVRISVGFNYFGAVAIDLLEVGEPVIKQ